MLIAPPASIVIDAPIAWPTLHTKISCAMRAIELFRLPGQGTLTAGEARSDGRVLMSVFPTEHVLSVPPYYRTGTHAMDSFPVIE